MSKSDILTGGAGAAGLSHSINLAAIKYQSIYQCFLYTITDSDCHYYNW